MITTIYKLERNIDGYGGLMPDMYFFNFEDAIKKILDNGPVDYNKDSDEWFVYGMKDCRVTKTNNSFYLAGIQYTDDEKDEWSINWCRINITPITLEFPISDSIWTIEYCKGYRSWLYRAFDSNGITDDGELNRNTIIRYCKSKKEARKISARDKKLKQIPRVWNRNEERELISPIGAGMDYLSIKSYQIN